MRLRLIFFGFISGACVGCAAEQPYFAARFSDSAPEPSCQRYRVDSADFTFEDQSRSYRLGDETGAPIARVMESTVWYPREAPAGPLIVYSHGFMSTRSEAAYLAKALASCGYVVVAPNFPRSRLFAPGGSRLEDVVEQPRDITFLLDAMLVFNRQAGHVLEKKIDPERIGAAGVSLGGLTTTLATFHPQLHDARIRAAVSIAGPSETLGPRFFETRQVPFLIIAADADGVIEYTRNARALFIKAPFASMVTLHRATHLSFADASGFFFWARNPDLWACKVLGQNLPHAGVNPFEKIGNDEVGCVVPDQPSIPCSQTALPMAMRPHRQQLLTRLALVAFFESVFEADLGLRGRFDTYLRRDYGAAHPDARVEMRPDAKVH